MIGFILVLIHLLCIHGTILMLTCSKSIFVIGLMTFFTLIVFIQCHLFNGCILTQYETTVPGTSEKMTEFVKRRLGVKGEIENSSLEKAFVGTTLYFFLVKLAALTFEWTPVQKSIDGLFP